MSVLKLVSTSFVSSSVLIKGLVPFLTICFLGATSLVLLFISFLISLFSFSLTSTLYVTSSRPFSPYSSIYSSPVSLLGSLIYSISKGIPTFSLISFLTTIGRVPCLITSFTEGISVVDSLTFETTLSPSLVTVYTLTTFPLTPLISTSLKSENLVLSSITFEV